MQTVSKYILYVQHLQPTRNLYKLLCCVRDVRASCQQLWVAKTRGTYHEGLGRMETLYKTCPGQMQYHAQTRRMENTQIHTMAL
jgi:hypothetical protein